jgi:DNA-binding NarL/FixJ family response regulator
VRTDLHRRAAWGASRTLLRVAIVADHLPAAHTVLAAVRQVDGLNAVGVLDGRRPLTAQLRRLAPNVVVIDDMTHGGDPLARLRDAGEQVPGALRVLLSIREDPETIDRALEAGADTILCRALPSTTMGTVLREVARGHVIQKPRPARAASVAADSPLTSRELEILTLAAEGWTNARIAAELQITHQTVKFHLSNSYRKLGAANRTEASRYLHRRPEAMVTSPATGLLASAS